MPDPDPLSSPAVYQAFVYALPLQYASIRSSTLVYFVREAVRAYIATGQRRKLQKQLA